MSDRLRFVKPAVQAEPRRVAYDLRKIANVLDWTDNQQETTFYAGHQTDEGLGPVVIAWSQAALLIADVTDIDSVTLRAMAATIEKAEPHATLF